MPNIYLKHCQTISLELKLALTSLVLVLLVVAGGNYLRESTMSRQMFDNKMYDRNSISTTIDDHADFFANPLAYPHDYVDGSPREKDPAEETKELDSAGTSWDTHDLETYGREVLDNMQLLPEWSWHKAVESMIFSSKYFFASLGVILGASFLKLAFDRKQMTKMTFLSVVVLCLAMLLVLFIARLIIVQTTFAGTDFLDVLKQVAEQKAIWKPTFAYNLGLFVATYVHALMYFALGLLLYAITKLVLPLIIILIALPSAWVSLLYSLPIVPMYYFNRTISKCFVSLASPVYTQASTSFPLDAGLLIASLALLLGLAIYLMDR